MAMLASKDFIATKKLPPVGSTWWSLDEESNAYPSELTWHVLVSETFRSLNSYALLILGELFKFKSEVVHEQKSVWRSPN